MRKIHILTLSIFCIMATGCSAMQKAETTVAVTTSAAEKSTAATKEETTETTSATVPETDPSGNKIGETSAPTPNGGVNPDFSKQTNVSIDWDQVKSDTEDTLNKDDYPLGYYLDYAVHEDTKTIELIWPLLKEATVKDAVQYGRAYIKAFNDAARVQDFSIAPSSDTSYGGLWDKYTIKLQVYKNQDIMNPENYYVDQTIPAGSNQKVQAKK